MDFRLASRIQRYPSLWDRLWAAGLGHLTEPMEVQHIGRSTIQRAK